MDTQWWLYPDNPLLSTQIGQLVSRSPLIGQLFLNRNLKSLSSVKQFLSPQHHSPENPAYVQALDTAIACIEMHRKNNSPILIYGDYDVDGVTSTSMMVDTLRRHRVSVDYMIPHRFLDGYGLSARALERLETGKYKLLILLDCGITNHTDITHIRSLGIDVIVMDHHAIPEQIPPATAILNPKFLPLSDPFYPLCTAGIVLTFLMVYHTHVPLPVDPLSYLDLAAVGTVADVAPLVGENRWIVQAGLSALRHAKRPGINELIDVANLSRKPIDVRDIAFGLAPRLNAPGRLGDAHICVELLTALDGLTAAPLARKIQSINENRQSIGQWMLKQVDELLAIEDISQLPVILLHGDEWHPGVIGITASHLVRRYHKPVVLLAGGPVARGSARSVKGVDIYRLLSQTSSYFQKFGGHREAAGFSIETDKISDWKTACYAAATTQITPTNLLSTLDIDARVQATDLTFSLANELQELAPFGQGNPKPVFYTNELTAVDIKTVGNGAHVKATLTHPGSSMVIDAIGFDMAAKIKRFYKPTLELAFSLETNEWNGRTALQLQVLDIKS